MPADIDALLLDRVFQPATDRAGEQVSCFGLARAALLGAVSLQVLVLVDDLQAFADPVFRLAVGGITALAFLGADQGRRMIARVERQSRAGTMNVRRITLRSQRMAWLLVVLFTAALAATNADSVSVHNGMASLCWLAAIYFASCTPRPPSVARRRTFASGPFGMARAGA